MARRRDDVVYCRGCGLQGTKLEIIQHYLCEELSLPDVPFECRECHARFHRRRVAVWHMRTEHGCQKPILDAFNGSLLDLPVYQMVVNNLNPRWNRPRHGGRRPFRQRHNPLKPRERQRDHDRVRPAIAPIPSPQPVPSAPSQKDDRNGLPKENQDQSPAVMDMVEQRGTIKPSDLVVRVTRDPTTSESEDEGVTRSSQREESDSDSDSQHSTCWKRTRRENTGPSLAQAATEETSMANTARDQGTDQPTAPENQSSDAVADAIPVLEKLTEQLATATEEWCNLRGVYRRLTEVLEEHIRVMEQNNEYHRYRLLMDGGKHRGAVMNIRQSTDQTRRTSTLQRVDKAKPSDQELLI